MSGIREKYVAPVVGVVDIDTHSIIGSGTTIVGNCNYCNGYLRCVAKERNNGKCYEWTDMYKYF